jgi:hypothetical protein
LVVNSFVNPKASKRGPASSLAFILGGGIAVAAAFLLLASSPARAKPEFTAQTKLPCGRCHTAPTGGKDLTDFGKEFKDNGFKLKN